MGIKAKEQLYVLMNKCLDLFDEVREKHEMTPRQWRLYRIVRDSTQYDLFEDNFVQRPISIEMICDMLPEDYQLNTSEKSHGNLCAAMYKDVEQINLSTEVEKQIVIIDHELVLADKEAIENRDDKLMQHVYNMMDRLSASRAKRLADGQGKMVSDQDKIIDENSKARDYVESYAK